jgi:hypothetical protein
VSDAPGLSPEQQGEVREAAARLKAVLRPARIARVNGWTVGVFGALSVLFGLVSGGGGIFVGVALIAIAWNEMRGARMLKALDSQGARVLGWNQLLLGGLIALYCAFTIWHAGMSPDPSMKELEDLGGIPAGLVSQLTTLLYGAVAVIVGIVQVLLARYHFRAEAKVHAFVNATPEWVRAALAAASGV